MQVTVYKTKKYYEKHKKAYLKSEHKPQHLTDILNLLLSGVLHDDLLFCYRVAFKAEQFVPLPIVARQVLSQFYFKARNYVKVVGHLLPLFNSQKIKSEYAKMLQVAAEEVGLLDVAQRVIAQFLKETDDPLFWQIRGINFQTKFRNVLKIDEGTLYKNIDYVRKQELTPRNKVLLSRGAFNMRNLVLGEEIIFEGLRELDFAHGEKSSKLDFNATVAYEFLKEIMQKLEVEGLKPFLSFGTLLGLVRDGKIFDHDKDSDIGLLDVPQAELETVLTKLCSGSDITAPDMVKKNFEERRNYITVYNQKNGACVDIFTYNSNQAHVETSLTTNYGTIKWIHSPFDLVMHDFGGDKFWIPTNHERFLEETYTKGWIEPVILYDGMMESPNISEDSVSTARIYAILRGETAIANSDFKKARYYFRHAIERGSDAHFILEKIEEMGHPQS